MANTGRQTTEYTLMHKDIPVATVLLDNRGIIRAVHDVNAPDHLPLGLSCTHGIPGADAVNSWWLSRGIPSSRQGMRPVCQALNLHSTPPMLKRSLGLSLTDQYWIRPYGSGMSWKDASFFTNPFSEDIGDMMFGFNFKAKRDICFNTPDIACSGNLKKRWKAEGSTRWLIKAGSYPGCQEPVNECIASAIADLLGIPHVTYSLYWHDGLPYCVCKDFISADTELIPACPILETRKLSPGGTPYKPYDFFIQCCTSLGIPDPRPFLDRMIVFDYIIANEDRHYENFGFIRDADTLEWLGPAPLYDSGYSLGSRMSSYAMRHQKPRCMPFLCDPDIQLNFVSDYSWLDPGALDSIPDIICSAFAGLPEGFISTDKRDAILDTTRERLDSLKRRILHL
ncbi:MAG: excisionase [Clostridia bacterium]|nr:excisionase [Clostridia bacterium]